MDYSAKLQLHPFRDPIGFRGGGREVPAGRSVEHVARRISESAEHGSAECGLMEPGIAGAGVRIVLLAEVHRAFVHPQNREAGDYFALRKRARTTSHFRACVVGRTPWSARDPLVPLRQVSNRVLSSRGHG